MTCRNCKFLALTPDKLGRILARKRYAYKCEAPVVMPPLSASVTKHYGYREEFSRSYMSPEDGEGCPVYEKRVKP